MPDALEYEFSTRAGEAGQPRNVPRHRAAPMTPTIFQDRIAAPVHAVVLPRARPITEFVSSSSQRVVAACRPIPHLPQYIPPIPFRRDHKFSNAFFASVRPVQDGVKDSRSSGFVWFDSEARQHF